MDRELDVQEDVVEQDEPLPEKERDINFPRELEDPEEERRP